MAHTTLTGPARAGVVVSFGMALAIFMLRLIGSNLPMTVELPGAIALAAVVATPPTLALLSTRRPVLLIAAGVTAVSTLFGLSIFALPMVVVGVIWIMAFRGAITHTTSGRTIVVLSVAWLFTVSAFAILFLHLDPRCSETLVDGTVRSVESSDESGWIWEASAVTSGSMTSGGDVVFSACSSDMVTLAEAAASLGLVLLAVGTPWRLAEPVQHPHDG